MLADAAHWQRYIVRETGRTRVHRIAVVNSSTAASALTLAASRAASVMSSMRALAGTAAHRRNQRLDNSRYGD